ncbi:ATP phosphoribosyltransferase 2, chloroplastic-like [Camellia sinensis]|uniref:ATP phosphoribosyltransferase 2, chloroplastic-like n=1 Tax=Camellia sinensis TaxID=4442 RepID=UPI0010368DEA|nr:ATP phosphoribosyltransferase 2, chloroplastic-like [Camellia sinensis]
MEAMRAEVEALREERQKDHDELMKEREECERCYNELLKEREERIQFSNEMLKEREEGQKAREETNTKVEHLNNNVSSSSSHSTTWSGTEEKQLSNLEVWFQWPKDIVRKLVSGDLDLGIVGLDTVSEYGQGNEDLILVHDALEFGDCRLSLAIPKYGIFENANSMKELVQMSQWTPEKPLRVATGFTYLGPKFMKENGVKHVTFSTADGALEAAPAMGIAEAIVDLVSRGTTLRENNLKEIEGGVILQSQAVLVASKKSLTQRKGVLDITHEILERLEAHLRAIGQFTVTANMRGSSQEEVAERILSQTSLSGLQGPTISPIFCQRVGRVASDYYAIVICVPKKLLYKSVQQLRAPHMDFIWFLLIFGSISSLAF